MSDGARIQVLNLQSHNVSLERLRNVGVRTSEINKIFKIAARPLVRTAKMWVNKSKKGVYDKRYPSRTHVKGTLRRSIEFKKSKKYNRVYFVGPMSKKSKGRDTWYNYLYVYGTKHYKGTPYMDRANRATKNFTSRKVDLGIRRLQEREFSR